MGGSSRRSRWGNFARKGRAVMTGNATIKKTSSAEIETARIRGQSETRADAPEAEPLGEDFWTRAVHVRPRERKASVHGAAPLSARDCGL